MAYINFSIDDNHYFPSVSASGTTRKVNLSKVVLQPQPQYFSGNLPLFVLSVGTLLSQLFIFFCCFKIPFFFMIWNLQAFMYSEGNLVMHFLWSPPDLVYRDTINRVLFYIKMTVMMSWGPHKVLKFAFIRWGRILRISCIRY